MSNILQECENNNTYKGGGNLYAILCE